MSIALPLLALMLAACATSEKSPMSERTTAPYGSWPSPISAESLAGADVSMSDLRAHGGDVYWLESRPNERGRQVLMRLRDGEINGGPDTRLASAGTCGGIDFRVPNPS